MIMATISENLQIIKDSTDAIKQAIIDKGGTINGDITTWASAIGGLSSGGNSSEEEITFTGTIDTSTMEIIIDGTLSKSFSNTKRVWVITYTDDAVASTTLLSMGENNVSLRVSAISPTPINSSDISLLLTDLSGGNAKIIKINL